MCSDSETAGEISTPEGDESRSACAEVCLAHCSCRRTVAAAQAACCTAACAASLSACACASSSGATSTKRRAWKEWSGAKRSGVEWRPGAWGGSLGVQGGGLGAWRGGLDATLRARGFSRMHARLRGLLL